MKKVEESKKHNLKVCSLDAILELPFLLCCINRLCNGNKNEDIKLQIKPVP